MGDVRLVLALELHGRLVDEVCGRLGGVVSRMDSMDSYLVTRFPSMVPHGEPLKTLRVELSFEVGGDWFAINGRRNHCEPCSVVTWGGAQLVLAYGVGGVFGNWEIVHGPDVEGDRYRDRRQFSYGDPGFPGDVFGWVCDCVGGG